VRPGSTEPAENDETGGCVHQVTLKRAPNLATRENQRLVPLSATVFVTAAKAVAGVLHRPRHSSSGVTATKVPSVDDGKVNNMLGTRIRVNQEIPVRS
jgi:hypothetical protein